MSGMTGSTVGHINMVSLVSLVSLPFLMSSITMLMGTHVGLHSTSFCRPDASFTAPTISVHNRGMPPHTPPPPLSHHLRRLTRMAHDSPHNPYDPVVPPPAPRIRHLPPVLARAKPRILSLPQPLPRPEPFPGTSPHHLPTPSAHDVPGAHAAPHVHLHLGGGFPRLPSLPWQVRDLRRFYGA